MRHRDSDFKAKIIEFVYDFESTNGRTPTIVDLANCYGVHKSTIHRYLKEMTEEGSEITYDYGRIQTKKNISDNDLYSRVAIVGSVPCGPADNEEEYVESYVNLPADIFGKGDFYLLRASGDSMEDAGIFDKDLVLIERTTTARIGDIVVSLDEDNCNTLKRYGGIDKKGAILEYMNEAVYPNKKIYVKELVVQGVAVHVLHKLDSSVNK